VVQLGLSSGSFSGYRPSSGWNLGKNSPGPASPMVLTTPYMVDWAPLNPSIWGRLPWRGRVAGWPGDQKLWHDPRGGPPALTITTNRPPTSGQLSPCHYRRVAIPGQLSPVPRSQKGGGTVGYPGFQNLFHPYHWLNQVVE